MGMEFGQFARWNLLAAALWTLGASLSAYGVASAVGGDSLLHSALPLIVAVLALVAIAALGLRHHRARRAASELTTGAPFSG
jgi:membrane protein DedA with SNARE-associated domain